MSASKPDTWMPIYWGDYLRDTNHLSASEHGAYLLLIAHYWTTGSPIPSDDKRLSRIARMSPREWKRSKNVISEFFEIEGGLWFHGRVQQELDKAVSKTEARVSAGKKGGESKWGAENRSDRNQKTRSERLSEARKKGTHTNEEWAALIWVFDQKCVRCGDGKNAITKDHIIPIYQGGSDAIDNLQPLCQSCNGSKGPEGTDHRKNVYHDWEKRLTERLAKPEQTPRPSPSPSPSTKSKDLAAHDPDAEERDLFRRGKAILGNSAGGFISRLLKANKGSVPHARAAIEQASTKDNPRQWIGGAIKNAGQRNGLIDPDDPPVITNSLGQKRKAMGA